MSIRRLAGADPEKLIEALERARETTRRRKICMIAYNQRPEVKARKAELRAARRVGIKLPRKQRATGYGGRLTAEEIEMLRTLPYAELPVYLKAYVDERAELLKAGDMLTDEDKAVIETVPYDALPVYLQEYLALGHNDVVTYDERVLMLNTKIEDWPEELYYEVLSAVDARQEAYRRTRAWQEEHIVQDREARRAARERYFATPNGIEKRRKAQREYQARKRREQKLSRALEALKQQEDDSTAESR